MNEHNKFASLSSNLLNLEKKIKTEKFSQEVRTIQEYLLLLREDRIQKLIKSNNDRDMQLLVGEIRSYDKLIPLLTV